MGQLLVPLIVLAGIRLKMRENSNTYYTQVENRSIRYHSGKRRAGSLEDNENDRESKINDNDSTSHPNVETRASEFSAVEEV